MSVLVVSHITVNDNGTGWNDNFFDTPEVLGIKSVPLQLSTTNPIQTVASANLVPPGEKPRANSLRYGT